MEKPKWIKFEDQMPENGQDIFLATRDGYVSLGTYEKCGLVLDFSHTRVVPYNEFIAWMPRFMPKPYTE